VRVSNDKATFGVAFADNGLTQKS